MTQHALQFTFPEILERFRATIPNLRVRGLVLVGTRQETTASLLLAALNPERVALLLTDETRASFPAKVRERLGEVADLTLRCPPEQWYCPDGDHTSMLNVYQGLRSVLERWPDLARDEIAVDLTGGKSTMTVGLAKAAHVLRLSSVYIDSDFVGNLPAPGTQRLLIPDDPYAVFGDLEAAEARRLHNHHDYASAANIFRDLARRVPNNADYRIYASLADAYLAWDNFAPRQAGEGMDLVLRAEQLPADLRAARHVLEAQRAVLTRLTSINQLLIQRDLQPDQALVALTNLDMTLALLGTLHAAALRRVEQERYDIAALLRYRCLELLSQHRLAGYGIWTAKPSFNEALRIVPDLEQRYRNVQRLQRFRKQFPLPSPDRSIAMFDGYMLLQALDDDLVQNWKIDVIRKQSYVRNTSILAHGFRPIARQEYDEFADVVDELLDRYFAIIRRSRVEWENTHRFAMLDE